MKHKLKTINPYFSQIWEGKKTFEVRKNDRDFQPGDTLALKEYDPENDAYLGREIIAEVGSILHGGQYGIEKGFCVMSIVGTFRSVEASTIASDSAFDHSGFINAALGL